MDVSIIIVSYNTRDLTLQCIKSIYEFSMLVNFEVIVVDNSSTDNTCELIKHNFPQVNVIEAGENLGFGRANNLGAKHSTGKYLFFLNSDCILIENTLVKLFEFMELRNIDNSIGVVGVSLLDASHNLGYSYHRFPTFLSELRTSFLILLGRISIRLYSFILSNMRISQSKSEEVECILGADMFMKKEIFHNLGGFDEQFLLYFEETDIQQRMAYVGLKRIIINHLKLIHIGEGSTKPKSSSLKKWILFNDSRFKYVKKHWPKTKYWVFCLLMIPLLSYPLFVKKYSKKDKNEYLNVLKRRSLYKIS